MSGYRTCLLIYTVINPESKCHYYLFILIFKKPVFLSHLICLSGKKISCTYMVILLLLLFEHDNWFKYTNIIAWLHRPKNYLKIIIIHDTVVVFTLLPYI